MNNQFTHAGFAVLLSVVAAVGALSQPAEMMNLEIELTGSCAGIMDLWVVTNGQDDRARAIGPRDGCRWVLRILPVDTETSDFSLRIGDRGRTPCRRATLLGSTNVRLALNERDIAYGRKVEITGPRADYVRQVSAPNPARGDIPCTEEASVPGPVYGLHYDVEDLRLQVLEKKAVACGVILTRFTPLVKAKSGDTIEITPKILAQLVQDHAWMAKNCHAPTFTPIEPLQKHLDARKTTFVVKVY